MREKLASKPEILEKILPKDWSFGCRRPTPGPGYLEALCDPKVETHLQEMREMTETGFIDHKGEEHEVDVFICVRGNESLKSVILLTFCQATGYETSYVPAFPVLSRGVNLKKKWANQDVGSTKDSQ